MSERDGRPDWQIRTLLVMVAVVAVPVALTHATIRVPWWERHTVPDPTPLGYTVSLLIFAVPVAVIVFWHRRHSSHYDKRAFLYCAGLMTALGSFLDVFFAYHFFEFPNRNATLGIRAPAFDWSTLSWVQGYIPVEEFGFYLLGAIFMVAVYLWADEHWLSSYDPHRHEVAPSLPRILQVSFPALALWVALLAYGIVHRLQMSGTFPAYYMFLMGAGLLPSIVLVRNVKQFVNWPALAFTFTALVLLSLIWEATMGVPYEWWIYRDRAMLGIYLAGWGNLPLEAVLLWLVGVWDAILFYEFFRIRHRMEERRLREALFGIRPPTSEVG